MYKLKKMVLRETITIKAKQEIISNGYSGIILIHKMCEAITVRKTSVFLISCYNNKHYLDEYTHSKRMP